jgi:hypothetical protein
MNSQQVIIEMEALALPTDQYVVVGGAALAIRGLRSTEDIDLVATPPLFERLKSQGWAQKTRPNGQLGLKRGCVEVYLEVNTESFARDINWLIAHSELVEGIPLADLDTLLGWKRTYGRQKDARDVELLEKIIREKTGAHSVA